MTDETTMQEQIARIINPDAFRETDISGMRASARARALNSAGRILELFNFQGCPMSNLPACRECGGLGYRGQFNSTCLHCEGAGEMKGPLRFVDEGHPFGMKCYDRNGQTVPLHPAIMGAVRQALSLARKQIAEKS